MPSRLRRTTRSIKVTAALLLLYSFTACKNFGHGGEPPDYLKQAFSQMAKRQPPSLDPSAQQRIPGIISDIRRNASQQKLYTVEPRDASDLGYRAFPAIAPLLKDPNPWVRESAVSVLFQLDLKRSLPFVLGMLLDTGRIQFSEDDVFVDTTVGRHASGLLASAFQGSRVFPIPVEEIGQPQAPARAEQRWYAYHLPYCSCRSGPQGELCWLDYRALYSHVPAEELPARLKSDPKKFQYVPVVWPQVTDSEVRVFPKGQFIRVALIFQNFGTEMFSWPQHSEGTHILRLVGPDGRDVPATAKLNEFMKQAITPPVPPGYSLGWTIDLNDAYDISRPGYYRFYYSYRFPWFAGRSDFEQTLDLQYWNGREYAPYYDFIVK